ncbi:hypothetical protein [Pseudomonas aeruginosa]|uniref:hypothetical protein n=1 Tax=Pseudomonas aeruginosa TaxID=287 RepID=UPI000AE9729D|nr:hypothetical protein [Pseudomonas aeruginosa]
MTWSYLRRDFLPPLAICTFCRRPLHSEKGIVITDEVGTEAFAGPSCAKKHLGQPEERLLDVSRLALLVVADEPAQHNELQALHQLERCAGLTWRPEPKKSERLAGEIDTANAEMVTLRNEMESRLLALCLRKT